MRNYVQPGDVLDLTAPTGGVVSGMGYVIGAIFAVATVDADVGDPFPGQVTGVVELPKLAAQAWSEGDVVYWDESEEEATTVSTGNVLIGVAVRDEANPTETGRVRLNAATGVGDTIATSELEDGSVTFAKAKAFVSTEQTGTGSAQNVAHGLGAAPSAVLVSITEIPDAVIDANAGVDVAEGTHTTTNVVLTVTSGVKFKVLAWA